MGNEHPGVRFLDRRESVGFGYSRRPGLKVVSAEWSARESAYKPINIEEKGDGRFVFSFEADLGSLPDGPLTLMLRAADAAGNTSLYELPVVLDATAPTLVMMLPPAGRTVGAQNTLVYQVPGDEILEEVAVSLDGETWTRAGTSSLYAMNLDLAGFAGLPESLKVRAIDRAGNVGEQSPKLSLRSRVRQTANLYSDPA